MSAHLRTASGSASSASYHQQYKALRLKLWETPPCWIDDPDEVLASTAIDDHGEHQAAVLLLRMQEFKVSKFHPDPIAAIEAACDKMKKRRTRWRGRKKKS